MLLFPYCQTVTFHQENAPPLPLFLFSSHLCQPSLPLPHSARHYSSPFPVAIQVEGSQLPGASVGPGLSVVISKNRLGSVEDLRLLTMVTTNHHQSHKELYYYAVHTHINEYTVYEVWNYRYFCVNDL